MVTHSRPGADNRDTLTLAKSSDTTAGNAQPRMAAKTTDKKPPLFMLVQFGMLLAIVAPLVLTLYAAVLLTHGTVSWGWPVAAFALASLTNLGTTAGYHRMLTHQAFRAHPVVQYTLLILGAIAGMSSPVQWARDHIYHHSHSDTPEDIHSPHTPLYDHTRFPKVWQWMHAHMGWTIRFHPVPVSKKADQIVNTPAARFVDKTCYFWLFAGIFAPLLFGWNAFVWLGMVRLFLNHHITWCVNSVCHLWGRQPFPDTRDKSRNNAVIGVLALGEGWHNNHHFRPTSARHGLLPGQLDVTYMVICLLERCKLVSHVQRYAPCPVCQTWFAPGDDNHAQCAQCRQSAQTALV